MATNAELAAMLQVMTPQSLEQMINYFMPAEQQTFIDAGRQKLFVQFPANTAAGQAVRAVYRAIDAGEDPQAVMDDFTAKFDAGEFDKLTAQDGSSLGALAPEEASEIVSAVSDTAIKREQFAKSRPQPLDVLKDLGLTELAPLLMASEQSKPVLPEAMTRPSTLAPTYESMLQRLAAQKQVADTAVEEAGGPRLASGVRVGPVTVPTGVIRNVEKLGGGIKESLPGGAEGGIGEKLKSGAISLAGGPLGMLFNFAKGAGKAAKKTDERLEIGPDKNQLAYAKFVQRQLDKKIKEAQKAQKQEVDFNRQANEQAMQLIAEYESRRPKNSTPFDVTKALLMKASGSK